MVYMSRSLPVGIEPKLEPNPSADLPRLLRCGRFVRLY